jgi:hypothetical protein
VKSAADFNLLDTLQIAGDEAIHARMLAWLLDHRIESYGTHAQGTRGFECFLREVHLDKRYAQTDYWVKREVPSEDSRVDIEVAAPQRFLIHIEVKIHSEEGKTQTVREWEDLQRRASELGVKPKQKHGFFLTLAGDQPYSKKFRVLRWSQIAHVLNAFAEKAQAPVVSTFAAHYARALERMTNQQPDTYEEDTQTNMDA